MTITVRFWRRKRDLEPDYNNKIEKQFQGENAAICMEKIMRFRENQNIAKYTRAEIINVED